MTEKNEEKHIKVNFSIKQSTLWKVATFFFFGLFVISLMTGGFGISGHVVENKAAPTNPTPTPTGVDKQIKVSIDSDDNILGDKKAKVSIVEFSDFECPFCGRARFGAIKQFEESDYFKDGKVNLVFKQFPLTSIHRNAQKAAEASECAGDQEKFFEYHDVLFENQKALDINSLKAYASQIGLNTEKFNRCLDTDEKASIVAEDLKQGMASGARGTPYFVVINKEGKSSVVSGAQPWENFEAVIKSLL